MYAVFVWISDNDFKDLTDDGGMKVHLFEHEDDAIEWAVDTLIAKGDIVLCSDGYQVAEEVKDHGDLAEIYYSRSDVLEAWQYTLGSMDFFHTTTVKDHRELGG